MRLRIVLFLCLIFPLLAGWGHWGPQVKIGFSVDNAKNKEALLKSMKEEMGDNRADLILADAKGDPATQEKQVKDLISQGVQALVVLPVDARKAAPLVEAAHQAGIKVVSLERIIPDSPLDYLVAFNAEKEGELQAGAMAKKVPHGGYVLLGGGQEFQNGQMKILQPLINKGDVQIRPKPAILGKAHKDVESFLKREGMTANAYLADNSETAGEFSGALNAGGLSGKAFVAGVGQDLGTCQRIAAGTQTLTVYGPPKKLAAEAAYLTAKVARNAKQFDCQFTELDNGKSKTLAVLLTPQVVDAKNLDSTIIADGVQKREEVYGK